MASGFAVTPDLQQIKQFEATSGRNVTNQAVQGITQQAIQTAASRSEQRRALDIQNQNLQLQQDKFAVDVQQQDINNQFRDTAFQAQQQQQAVQNKFQETAFQAQQQDMAKRFGLAQQELDFKIQNQSELVGLQRDRISLEAKRVGISEQSLLVEQEAQKFMQDLQTKKFDITKKEFQLSQSAFKETQIANRNATAIKNNLIADERRAAQRAQISDKLRSELGQFIPLSTFQNALNTRLAAFDARPASSFLPKGALA